MARRLHDFTDIQEGYRLVDAPAMNLDLLREWAEGAQAVWLELMVPEDSSGWFDDAANPWRRMDTPEVDWSHAPPVLEAVGIDRRIEHVDADDDLDLRMLALLPHLYPFGVARVQRELLKLEDRGDGCLFFPTVGFLLADHGPSLSNDANVTQSLPNFWTVRTSVGVVRNVVLTIRAPDVCCGGQVDAAQRSPLQVDLPVPRRFLPGRWHLGPPFSAEDVAEGIAIHHASTARAAAEVARVALGHVVRDSGVTTGDSHREPQDRSARLGQNALHEITRISEIVHELDGHVARELRRLADNVEHGHPIVGHAAMRYGFALDEIKSVQAELRTERSAILGDIQASETNERERFQFVAALLGSAILIPTLVAAIYGANVELPGRNSWSGFTALILFVISFALLGVLAVNALWTRVPQPGERWRSARRLRLATAVLALAALVTGLLALLSE